MNRQDRLDTVREERLKILNGCEQAAQKQHEAGKNTARERVTALFDAGSFVESDLFKKDGNVICGFGTVNDRPVACFAQDAASKGGAMCKAQSEKIVKLLQFAKLNGIPVIALLDSNGADIQEGADAMCACSDIMNEIARLSGVCPVIGCVMGPCRGTAALIASLCDLTVITEKTGELALNSALVLGKTLTAKDYAAQGMGALIAKNEENAIYLLTELLDLLPGCNLEDAPMTEGEDLNRTIANGTYDDGLSLIQQIADDGRCFELYDAFGTAVHTVLCRVGGRACGVVASDYNKNNGRLDIDACGKIARFVRFLDCYQLPVISLTNSDGIEPENALEQGKMMTAAGQLLYAYAESTSPKLAVITGHAVGGAYIAMGGRKTADISFAWPQAFVSPLTAEVAVQVLCDTQLSTGADRSQLEQDYMRATDALYAASKGIVDDIIDPENTRRMLIAAMEMLASKHDVNLPKKHGNMPL